MLLILSVELHTIFNGIPPIDEPNFISIDEASAWLADKEPVFVVSVNSETRLYPLQILICHEVVNDEVGGSRWL